MDKFLRELFLKSLCTDDYELFLAISSKSDTDERQDIFKSLKKGFVLKLFQKLEESSIILYQPDDDQGDQG